jgi:carboxyl-terminal processing protease
VRGKAAIAATILTLSIGLLLVRMPVAIADQVDRYEFVIPLVDVLSSVEDHFLREPNFQEMQTAAINGMLESLNDPYTVYIPPAQIREFDKSIRGSYVGIGAEVSTSDGFMQIVSPMDDSPAYKAGIEADDLVVAVNAQSTYGKDINDIIDNLMGEPGTEVLLTIERQGVATDKPPAALEPSVPGPLGDAPGPKAGNIRFDLPVVRQRIHAATIKGFRRDGEEWSYWANPVDKIAYIRVTQFTDTTIPALSAATRRLVEEGMRGLILDLRFNTGGSLDAAIAMANLFLDEGTIVSTRGRSGPERRATAESDGTLPDFPLVVLVNGSSASASEIVAGALSDNNRAIILGERTFGKGSVQGVYRLADGQGQLKITEAYYYLPSGRKLHREDDSTVWGVDPTDGFYVPMTAEENREMWRVRRDLEILRDRDDTDAQSWSDPVWILDHMKDKQLSAAVATIHDRLESGQWTPTGESVTKETYAGVALEDAERRARLLERELERVASRIEALGSVAESKGPRDLLPDDAELRDGRLEVYDAEGNVVARLRITAANLEAWLVDAPLELETSDQGEPVSDAR